MLAFSSSLVKLPQKLSALNRSSARCLLKGFYNCLIGGLKTTRERIVALQFNLVFQRLKASVKFQTIRLAPPGLYFSPAVGTINPGCQAGSLISNTYFHALA